jgi:hypothetical protein
MCRWLIALLLALPRRRTPNRWTRPIATAASRRSRPRSPLVERSGDREGLRDHVRSFGCKLIWPKLGLDPLVPGAA